MEKRNPPVRQKSASPPRGFYNLGLYILVGKLWDWKYLVGKLLVGETFGWKTFGWEYFGWENFW